MNKIALTLGPMKTESWIAGNPLTADLIYEGETIGSVHQNGYQPKWAFQINQFRWKYLIHPAVSASSPFELGGLKRLLFDGASFSSAQEAKEAVEVQLTRFLKKLSSSPGEYDV